jgi:AcrR family transcriptional regulator
MAAQTRRDILVAARRLFAERGYAATSVVEIAQEAGVAVQTIYSRLGSKGGVVLALLDLLDEESGLPETTAGLLDVREPRRVLRIGIRAFRGFPEHCGDVLDALTAAATVEPDAAAAVAEAFRRHRDGCRLVIDLIAELDGLRAGLTRERAVALLAATTFLESWNTLVHRQHLSWDEAEELLTDSLARALLDG